MTDSAPELRLLCECGEWIATTDPYLCEDVQKIWREWHEDGAFLAGKYHRLVRSADRTSSEQK